MTCYRRSPWLPSPISHLTLHRLVVVVIIIYTWSTTVFTHGFVVRLQDVRRTTTTKQVSWPLLMASFSSPSSTSDSFDQKNHRHHRTSSNNSNGHVNQIGSTDEAWRIIDECAVKGTAPKPTDRNNNDGYDVDARSSSLAQLWDAVHFLEQHSYQYSQQDLQQLWQNAHGSWRFILSTGSSHSQEFRDAPWFLPKFQFAYIDDEYFGNGLGPNPKQIWLALKDKHKYDFNKRRLEISVDDVYVLGRKVTNPLDGVMSLLGLSTETTSSKKQNQKEQKTSTSSDKKPPPTFVLIGASQHALVARGNQSGGIALWSRLDDDIRPVAYGEQRP